MTPGKDIKILCPHCGWWNPGGIQTPGTPEKFHCFRCGKDVVQTSENQSKLPEQNFPTSNAGRENVSLPHTPSPQPISDRLIVLIGLLIICGLGGSLWLVTQIPWIAPSKTTTGPNNIRAKSDYSLCGEAIAMDAPKANWSARIEAEDYVKEAKARGLSAAKCRELWPVR